MDEGRFYNRISCKAALYTPDRRKVLVVESRPGKYSLPGGHMEEGEVPDETIRRELHEELGLADLVLRRKDFWLHKSGKLILGFAGTLSEDVTITIQEAELERALWVDIRKIADGEINLRSYTDFIISAQ